MKRVELEHIIRAVAALTNQSEFVIVGSQSILGAYPEAPAILCASVVVDILSVEVRPQFV